MPQISSFYGISIYMYWNDNKRHKFPHFHAYYAEQNAVFDLRGNLIEGNFPKRAKRLINEWALENHLELEYAWKSVTLNKIPEKIRGLK